MSIEFQAMQKKKDGEISAAFTAGNRLGNSKRRNIEKNRGGCSCRKSRKDPHGSGTDQP